MKSLNLSQILLFLFIALTFTGCDVILDIFEAGVWVGIIIVILVIALLIWLIKKMLS